MVSPGKSKLPSLLNWMYIYMNLNIRNKAKISEIYKNKKNTRNEGKMYAHTCDLFLIQGNNISFCVPPVVYSP